MPDSGAERVALIREGLEAFRRGDTEGLMGRFADDLVIVSPPGAGVGGSFHGHDGYREWLRQWLEAWDDFAVEPLRIEPVGERHVVAETRQSARGKGSGVPVTQPMSYLYEIRDGQVAEMHLYPSWNEAVEVAAGREASAR
jgi:ketosteroid isomerase-like protein